VKIFFSGASTERTESDPRLGTHKRYRLLSCHADYFKSALNMIKATGKMGVEYEWMFDSGAFTAWSKGRSVPLQDLKRSYAAVINEVKKSAPTAQCWLINLDVIPGQKGRTAGVEEVEAATVQSDINFHELVEEFGPIILPVYHQNESEERLHAVVALSEYICVSPRNDMHETARKKWSAEVHQKIPGVKTHGLAVTGFDHMNEVPWWSSDSATWIMLAVYGCVLYPKGRGMMMLPVSTQSGSTSERGKHYITMTDFERESIDATFAKYGFNFDELSEDNDARALFNRVMLDNYSRDVVLVRRETMPAAPPSLFSL
jgi:hypothetical protein